MEASISTSESQQSAGSAVGEGPQRLIGRTRSTPTFRVGRVPHKIGGETQQALVHRGYFNSE
jgi:hypothetical protein